MFRKTSRILPTIALAAAFIGIAAGCGNEPARPADEPAVRIEYTYGEDVSQETRDGIEAAVAQAGAWLKAEIGVDLPGAHITAGASTDEFVAGLQKRFTMTGADTRAISRSLQSGGALTVGHEVFIAIDERWRQQDAEQRSFVVAHEIFHVVQYTLASGLETGPRGGDVPGPGWLVEGAADYAAARARAAAGGMSLDRYRALYMNRARGMGDSLRDLEGRTILTAWGAQSRYTLGFLATDVLVSRSGIGALTDLWRNCSRGQAWDAAFEAAFGESLPAFYDRFDEYLAAAGA